MNGSQQGGVEAKIEHHGENIQVTNDGNVVVGDGETVEPQPRQRERGGTEELMSDVMDRLLDWNGVEKLTIKHF